MTGRDRVDAYLAKLDVPRETLLRLDEFVACLLSASKTQNLISAGTLPELWDRHIPDSVQLIGLGSEPTSSWLDIGSGAGLPGLVVAATCNYAVTLSEPRSKRVEFLRSAASKMAVEAAIFPGRAEMMEGRYDTISARAVAPLSQLFSMTHHLSHEKTRFVFPKGRTARNELETARRSWQGRFELVQSVTDPDASIIVATRLRPRTSR